MKRAVVGLLRLGMGMGGGSPPPYCDGAAGRNLVAPSHRPRCRRGILEGHVPAAVENAERTAHLGVRHPPELPEVVPDGHIAGGLAEVA